MMSTLPEIFLFPLSSFSFVRNGRGERGKRKIPEVTSLPVAPPIAGAPGPGGAKE
jgi:hypothetical protein